MIREYSKKTEDSDFKEILLYKTQIIITRNMDIAFTKCLTPFLGLHDVKLI